MDVFFRWFSQLDWGKLIEMAINAMACLICVVIHEVCHGLAAFFLGDDTARRSGRLTLNPLKHIDLVGIVLLITVGFGWAKPVPVNMRNFRRPKRDMVLTSLAGPLSNALLALFLAPCYAATLVRYYSSGSLFAYYLAVFLIVTISRSIGLLVFNLIPIPPLDGSKVLFGLLPPRYYFRLMRYERYGMILLVALLYLGLLNTPLSFLRNEIQQFIFTVAVDPVVQLLMG